MCVTEVNQRSTPSATPLVQVPLCLLRQLAGQLTDRERPRLPQTKKQAPRDTCGAPLFSMVCARLVDDTGDYRDFSSLTRSQIPALV